MADKKISQLTAATTPLAGTEVLPIVQSGSTVKVSVDNLTNGKTVNASALTASGAVTGATLVSTVATGTAPLTVASSTKVANLNASSIDGYTFASPGAIGGTTPGTGKFTEVQATGSAAFKTNSTSGQYYHFDAATGNNFMGNQALNEWALYIGGTLRLLADDPDNLVVGSAAIATNATNGFLYIPSCAGTPTGTPTAYTGRVPLVVDTTNNKLYFYSGGQWRDAGP